MPFSANVFGQGASAPVTGSMPGGNNAAAGGYWAGPDQHASTKQPVAGAGVGPLKGWLMDGNQLTAPFQDGGRSWITVQDKWGNVFVLLLGSNKTYSWKVDRRSQGFAETCTSAYYLDTTSEAYGVFKSACESNLDANEFDPGTGVLPPFDPSPGAIIGTPGAVQVDSFNYFGEANVVTDGSGNKLQPGASYSRYIDNVPVHLPVSDDMAKDFGGWFTVRIDRYTRCAVLTGLYFQSWGDLQTMKDKLCNLDTLWTAIVKTLVGLVQIVVGVLCIVGTFGGCVAAGVAMIVTGLITICQGWYDFDDQRKKHESAVKKALETASETGTAGGKGHLDGLTNQGDTGGSKKNSWSRWMALGAAVGIPVAAKYAALI